MVASKKQGAGGATKAKKEAKKGRKKETKKEKETKAAKKSTKVSAAKRVAGVKGFFNGVKVELKKVHWPTRKETVVYTGVVLSTVVIISFLIWILDSILSHGLSVIIG